MNGKHAEITERIQRVIDYVQKLAKTEKQGIKIESENNFNTAAGLASSASGLSCLGFALSKLYGLGDENNSLLARLGSGSACRSLDGGFVLWDKGWTGPYSDLESL